MLTDKQKKIYEYMISYFKTNNVLPAVAEMAAHFECQVNNIHLHLAAIERRGYIERRSGARNIRFTKYKVELTAVA